MDQIYQVVNRNTQELNFIKEKLSKIGFQEEQRTNDVQALKQGLAETTQAQAQTNKAITKAQMPTVVTMVPVPLYYVFCSYPTTTQPANCHSYELVKEINPYEFKVIQTSIPGVMWCDTIYFDENKQFLKRVNHTNNIEIYGRDFRYFKPVFMQQENDLQITSHPGSVNGFNMNVLQDFKKDQYALWQDIYLYISKNDYKYNYILGQNLQNIRIVTDSTRVNIMSNCSNINIQASNGTINIGQNCKNINVKTNHGTIDVCGGFDCLNTELVSYNRIIKLFKKALYQCNICVITEDFILQNEKFYVKYEPSQSYLCGEPVEDPSENLQGENLQGEGL